MLHFQNDSMNEFYVQLILQSITELKQLDSGVIGSNSGLRKLFTLIENLEPESATFIDVFADMIGVIEELEFREMLQLLSKHQIVMVIFLSSVKILKSKGGTLLVSHNEK